MSALRDSLLHRDPWRMQRFTQEERIFIIENYFSFGNAEAVRKEWMRRYGEERVPVRKTIYELRDKFRHTGSVADLQRSGRPLTALTTENKLSLTDSIAQNRGEVSVRRLSAELQISKSSISRILKDIGMKPFHYRTLHGLLEDDPDRRVQTCQEFMSHFRDDSHFFEKVLWSDEAIFKLNGSVNTHNCFYYALENEHRIRNTQLNQPGVTVWGAICSRGLIGPYFFPGNVDGQSYLTLLQTFLIPELHNRGLMDEFWFMQDGAPAHWSTKVRDFLGTAIPRGWIGRRGDIEWSPRSPDLTPMDYFFWGVLKDKVYHRDPKTLSALKAAISEEFASIGSDVALCKRVCDSVCNRMRKCIECDGQNFEHLL